LRYASSHKGNEPATAVDFKLAKNGVEMLFHHRQTQVGVISDLLITPPFTDKPGNFLFSPGQSDKMRQTRARRFGVRTSVTAQILALDKKMGLRHAARTELFQMQRRSQMWRSRMMHPFFFEASLRRNRALRVRPLLFEQTASIQNLARNR
jgi:hypothetical protein